MSHRMKAVYVYSWSEKLFLKKFESQTSMAKFYDVSPETIRYHINKGTCFKRNSILMFITTKPLNLEDN